MKIKFATLASVLMLLWATPSFAQFPWGALNNTLNQINQGVALQQNEQALRNQQEYLRQQAYVLQQQTQIARENLELKKQGSRRQNTVDEQAQCLKEWNSVKDFAEITDKGSEVVLKWKYDWVNYEPDFKKRLFYTLIVTDACATDKVRKLTIFQGKTQVAVADPDTKRIEILK